MQSVARLNLIAPREFYLSVIPIDWIFLIQPLLRGMSTSMTILFNPRPPA